MGLLCCIPWGRMAEKGLFFLNLVIWGWAGGSVGVSGWVENEGVLPGLTLPSKKVVSNCVVSLHMSKTQCK